MSGLLLDINLVNPSLHERDFVYPGDFGPGRSNQSLMPFHHISDWRDYLLTLQIDDPRVPTIHVDAYHAALRALLLAWVEPAVIKPAELQALRSLEGALRGVFFQPLYEKALARKPKLKPEEFKSGLGLFLDYMALHDGLPATLHSESKRDRGSALDTIRNTLAHGDPFNTLPWGGLFESVHEVITHAYRNHPEPATYPPQVYDMLGEGLPCNLESEGP